MTKKFKNCTILDIVNTCKSRDNDCEGFTGEYETADGPCPFHEICWGQPLGVVEERLEKEVMIDVSYTDGLCSGEGVSNTE